MKVRVQGPYRFLDTIVSEFPATIYMPKQIGKGYTGTYIDSVGTIAGNIADLSFYAENLDSMENVEMKQVINSLTLKPFR